MKSWAWAAICISVASLGAMSGVAGCSSDDPAGDGDSDSDSGDGGSGSGGTGSGNSGNVGPSSGSGTGSATGPGPSSSSGSSGMSCDDIGVCDMAGSCLECAVIGDPAEYSDAGQCEDPYVACFGTDDMCTGGNPDCCAFDDCAAACPEDDPATPADESLDCICTNDGMQCAAESMPGTCVGDHPGGFEVYLGFLQCIIVDVCPESCGG